MKEFFIKNLEQKIVGSMFFASEVLIYTIIAPFIGEYSLSLWLIWQMFLIAIVLTILQYTIYWWSALEEISTAIKVCIHYIIVIILGAVFTKLFNWFDLSNVKYALTGFMILTITFVVFLGSIGMYYKVTGDDFNEKLAMYKTKKKK